jgi:hypothetical protein
MIKDVSGDILQRGDLIAIAYNNQLYLGVFAKEGSRNNVNYYNLNKTIAREINEGRRVYCGYINTTNNRRFTKIKLEGLTLDEREWYDIIKNYLDNT